MTRPATGVPLSLSHREALSPLLAARLDGMGERAPADLTFTNLWLFRRAHDYHVLDGEWPAIAGRSYDGGSYLLPLFPLAKAPIPALRSLLDGHDGFFPVTERDAESLDARHFVISSRRDDADYLYEADSFRHYRGALLNKKRNLMRQCLARHRLRHEAYTPSLLAAALEVLDGWLEDKRLLPASADDLPCREALSLAPQLGLRGFLTWADDRPGGFVLAEQLQPGVLVVRFAKGRTTFKGIAQAMFHHLVTEEQPAVRWLNFEQDLGLPNFRRTKQSYQPNALLPKLRVRLRGRPARSPANWRKTPGGGLPTLRA